MMLVPSLLDNWRGGGNDVAAERRGRSGFGWFLVAILLSPLIGDILLAVLPDLYMRSLLEELRRSSAVDDRALEQAVKRGRRGG
jgi:hypothetical protein